ncbi:Peptide methionine sulfoxide reductase MsrA [Seminavis robusta]|uniref:peptide-methionine (S)-S-oxide reductase n=1 Tax=Seminavis robusta TaxID=568900 RepID=A0A9N8HU81_9STRA|nr:Peptide methionine sulfoxide reductase MsrA [Seminavis robusta]|eukprot:Sro2010_g310800.1 Peptide methionine sulfoxide reductase MsrA (246) ;mRNA; f:6157-6894
MKSFSCVLPVLLCSAGTTINAFAPHGVNKPTAPTPSRLQAKRDATFGMGCFWKPSEEMLKIDGVSEAAAGYTGNPNAKEVPDYDKVCFSRDWVEGVRVVYDDDKVSYEQLLDAFFEAQEPKLGSRQYASIIFPHDEEQQKIATEWLQEGADKVRESDGVPLSITQVEPLSPFYRAEGYHQNYWQKFRPRVAVVVGLIALQIAHFDVSPDIASGIDTFADWGLKAVALSVILERLLDRNVVELKSE